MPTDLDSPFGLRALAKELEERDAMFFLTVHEAIREILALRKLKDFDVAADRAAGELPEGWQIEIGIELHAGWIDVIDPDGKKTDMQLESPNAFAEAVVGGIEYARETEIERQAAKSIPQPLESP